MLASFGAGPRDYAADTHGQMFDHRDGGRSWTITVNVARRCRMPTSTGPILVRHVLSVARPMPRSLLV
jgi:hypothetical protein